MEKLSFIESVVPGAIKCQKEYNILASLTIAQAILESNWGKSKLAIEDKNLFGIKGKGTAGSVSRETGEYINRKPITTTAIFRKYNSFEESILDHAVLLTKDRYKKVIDAKGYKECCVAVQEAGYATDPEYAVKLIKIIEAYNLDKYDRAGGNSVKSWDRIIVEAAEANYINKPEYWLDDSKTEFNAAFVKNLVFALVNKRPYSFTKE